MSQMTNLVVKDDAATPKEYTFIPVTDTPFPQWRTNEANLPLEGQLRYSVQMVPVKDGYKLTSKLEVPVMETVGSSGSSSGYIAPPKVAHVVTDINTMFCSKRATLNDRINTKRMHMGILQGAGATTGGGVLTNTAVGGGWTASAAAIVSFFRDLITPN